MANYSARLARTTSLTLAVGVIDTGTTAPARFKIYDVILGSEATPADTQFLFVLNRHTAGPGTGTSITPERLETADAAFDGLVRAANSVNPTITAGAVLLNVPLNARMTFRWLAVLGSELVSPATASTGITLLTPTSTALQLVHTTIHFSEL